MVDELFARFVAQLKERSLLEAAQSLLDWDQETLLPPKAVAARSAQRGALAGVVHDKKTAPEAQELLQALREEDGRLSFEQKTVVNEVGRTLDRALRVPRELVQAIAEQESCALPAWAEARRTDDFAAFRPFLERTLELKRELAQAIGYETDLYDALLEEYEPGARVTDLVAVLGQLRTRLVPLLKRIVSSPRPPSSRFTQKFDIAGQRRLGRQVLTAIGFDFEAGRLDESNHPFCSGFHPTDVRLTTRYDEGDLRSALFSSIHEGGHGIYEQGLEPENWGTPLSQWTSMGIHESQSRLWENIIGRSRSFWQHFLPAVTKIFPAQFSGCTVEEAYRGVNEVTCSMIRVEADEVTYNLHIILRFELERALLSGDLAASDLPAAWREKMKEYLDIVPQTDAEGCLQDIHWGMGLFGYFPTYALGNLYAGMLWRTAVETNASLSTELTNEQLDWLNTWLRENIHRQGRRYSAGALVKRVTGRELAVDDFCDYLEAKYTELYS